MDASARIGPLIVIMLALLSSLPLPSPASPASGEDAVSLNRRGVELFRAGNLEEARRSFEEALDREPGFEEATRNLAHTLASLGNLGFQSGDLESAEEMLSEAIGLWGEEADFHVLLAAVYFRRGELYAARRSAEDALNLDEANSRALELVGDLDYQEGYLNRAVSRWEDALEVKGSHPSRLQSKIDRARRELDAEGGFEREVSVHFSLQHDGPVSRQLTAAVLDELERLYDEIGRELGTYPRGDIPVIIYSKVLFTEITRSPLWVAGTFDGKIRIPTGGLASEADIGRLRPVLAHELVHAFLRSMASRGLPLWFEEGLAKHFEGMPTPAVVEYLDRRELPLPSSLDQINLWLRGGGPSVETAYLSALLAVRAIIDDEGFWTVRRIVEAAGRGTPFEEALFQEARLEPWELEERWKSSLP